MPKIDRFSVSLDTELLAAFDCRIAQKGYETRSEAVRDMIRDLLVSDRKTQGNETVTAILTLVVDHAAGEPAKGLRARIAAQADIVFGSLSFTLDANRDRHAIVLRGPSDRVAALADEVKAMRGISHGHFYTLPPVN